MTFKILARSLRGVTHEVKNMPNQDSILVYNSPKNKNVSYAIACDGHGSGKCFRSDIGSELATKVLSIFFLKIFETSVKEEINLSFVNSYVNKELPKDIVLKWRELVDEHIELHPFTSKEKIILYGEEDDKKQDRKYIAYGTTLLGTLVTPSFILYVQLGDGDIVVLNSDNSIDQRFEEDDNLLGNETTSLCLEKAWNYFKIGFDVLENNVPKQISISTDGVSNAYANGNEDFLSFVSGVYDFFIEEGMEKLSNELTNWLQDFTNFSGDDVSIAIIWIEKKEKKELKEPIGESIIKYNIRNDDNDSKRVPKKVKKTTKKNSKNKASSFSIFLLMLFSFIAFIYFLIYYLN